VDVVRGRRVLMSGLRSTCSIKWDISK